MATNYSSFEEFLFVALKNAAAAKSVYDIWLELGNIGTPQDFIDSLKGEKGDKGDPGTGTGSGLSDREKYLMLSLFEGAAYANENMTAKYNELKTLWGDIEVIPVEGFSLDNSEISVNVNESVLLTATIKPDNATDKTITWSCNPEGYVTIKNDVVTGEKAGSCKITAKCGEFESTCDCTVVETATKLYELESAVTFTPSEKKVVDTGVKLFDTIDPKPQYTILLDFDGASTITASRDTFCLLHCMHESDPWPGISLAMWPSGNIGLNLYKVETTVLTGLDNIKARNALAIQIQESQYRVIKAGSVGDWTSIPGYTSTLSETLILGGFIKDGEYGRFWDGTVYRCEVYDGILSTSTVSDWIDGVTETTKLYELPAATAFVPSEKKIINTGVKLFETVKDPDPVFTILIDFDGASTITASRDTFCLLHCMHEVTPWPGMSLSMKSNGNVELNLYTLIAPVISGLSNAKNRNAVAIQVQASQYRIVSSSGTGSWTSITGYGTAVSEPLVLGGYLDENGDAGRFWDGTIYRCEVYEGILGSAAITKWINAME